MREKWIYFWIINYYISIWKYSILKWIILYQTYTPFRIIQIIDSASGIDDTGISSIIVHIHIPHLVVERYYLILHVTTVNINLNVNNGSESNEHVLVVAFNVDHNAPYVEVHKHIEQWTYVGPKWNDGWTRVQLSCMKLLIYVNRRKYIL